MEVSARQFIERNLQEGKCEDIWAVVDRSPKERCGELLLLWGVRIPIWCARKDLSVSRLTICIAP